ncbi:ABC transporter ATP-binding protein [Aeromonas enteropelogenes]|uniref:ABC transporter ATP-binding protein n=1 Tax=Aeromonas enteropelogenes TaxID=29489 RepID=UPI003BA32B2B
MAKLELSNINKIYPDGTHVIKDANLTIEEGQFTVFVGPSGCGKSTMLRMIAGLEEISSGHMSLDGATINDLSPTARGIGMVFQSYALYPHMTVYENIAFGLRMAKSSREQIQTRVKRVADMLELSSLLKQRPSQLSGGQRQRVAIGRAIARDPRLFLLDEPLSNLDASLRVRMRRQLSEYHKKLNSTIIYVTHDQVEAMTLADRIVVLNEGVIEQVGSPLDIYYFPQTLFVAGFIGSPKMNLLPATLNATRPGKASVVVGNHSFDVDVDLELSTATTGAMMTLGIRPEDIHIDDHGVTTMIEGIERLGTESLIYTRLERSDHKLLIRVPGTVQHSVNQNLKIQISAEKCHLFNNKGIAFKRCLSMTQPITPGASMS